MPLEGWDMRMASEWDFGKPDDAAERRGVGDTRPWAAMSVA